MGPSTSRPGSTCWRWRRPARSIRCSPRSPGKPWPPWSRPAGNPDELHRVVARRGDPVQARLVTDAIAAHLHGFREVDERWRAQADELGARVWWTTTATTCARRWPGGGSTGSSLLDDVLGLLATLRELPPLEVLLPPPGTSAPGPASDRAAAAAPGAVPAGQGRGDQLPGRGGGVHGEGAGADRPVQHRGRDGAALRRGRAVRPADRGGPPVRVGEGAPCSTRSPGPTAATRCGHRSWAS